jgi:tight adherence protein C
MISPALLLQMALALALLSLLSAVILVPMVRRRERVATRIRTIAVAPTARGGEAASGGGFGSWRLLRKLGTAVVASGLLSKRSLDDLENTMAASGHKTASTLPLFVGIKVVLLVGLPVATWLMITVFQIHIHPTILPVAVAGVIGMLAPDYFIRRTRKRYLAALEGGLPDALDLLIICSEAGLGLEAGMDRVAAEFADGNPATSAELRTTASEMKILSDRRRALMNMGARTKLEAMARLGGTLAQTIQYGTPISQALRVLAAEMRQTTLTRFEERAARLPVLLTVPMIVFILPCIFLIVGGPAVVQVMQAAAEH